MRKKIVGKQNVDYVSKKTNQQVTGLTLHCVSEDSRVSGLAVETIFLSSKAGYFNEVLNFPLNSEIDCSYNRWGNVDTITLCKK